jgi:predicted O-linked N-acetylglucosamine transferase (SPINDLY family)
VLNVGDTFAIALRQHQAGNLQQAEQLYRQILQTDPLHADTHHLLGLVAHQVGQHTQAAALIRQAIALNPNAAVFHSNLAVVYEKLGEMEHALASHQQALRLQPGSAEALNAVGNALRVLGRWEEAATHCLQAVRFRPDYAEAYSNLGNALYHQQKLSEAITQYQQALRFKPDFADARTNLVVAISEMSKIALEQHQLGNLQQAETLYRRILAADPHHAESLHLLGLVAYQTGRNAEAVASIRQAVAMNPHVALYHSNLAVVQEAAGQLHEAAASYQEALRLQPGTAEWHNGLGNVLRALGRLDDAAAQCTHALRLRPTYPEAHNNLGNVLFQQQRLDEAAAHYQEAVRLKPDYAEAYSNLGLTLADSGKREEAITHYQQALRIKPDYPAAHANLAGLFKAQGNVEEAAHHFQQALRLRPSNGLQILLATLLPPVYQSSADVLEWRERLTTNVRRLRESGVTLDIREEEAQPVFYLVYQGFNDRDLQVKIGQLYQAPRADRPPVFAPGIKCKVGFLSKYFRSHTIGHWMRGLVAQMSRRDFEVTVLSIGRHDDDIARFFKQHADRFVAVPSHLPSARRVITDQQLDVLIYADIGMERITYSLAFSRLAPVQCVTVGHPVTTGIDTIDFYLSSEQLESDEADAHYTETLVRLKTLPIYFYRPIIQQPLKDRAHFGLSTDDHVYACLQSTFKFHPDFDELMAGILRRDPRGVILIGRTEVPRWEELLRQRFAVTLPDVANRIRFMPKLNYQDYLNVLALSDVQLDTLYFGGGNTSYDGLTVGTPIVTLPTPFLRGRITLSLYKQMEMLDCVARDREDYVDIAVRLGSDSDYRSAMGKRILEANEVIFENRAGVAELERFLLGLTMASGGR